MEIDSLTDLVRTELATTVDPRVAAMARALAAEYPGAARAVLFYGSCLRETQLDGLMLDFYLIVSDYSDAYVAALAVGRQSADPAQCLPFPA